MKLSLNANMCDQDTWKLPEILRGPLKAVEKEVSGDYGGIMEHLWIGFELIRGHAEGRPPHRFRLQKKVGGRRCPLSGMPVPVYLNVGSYDVRPDFDRLVEISHAELPVYALELIYTSTSVLVEKRKRLGGFDAERFRENFVEACRKIGHPLSEAVVSS